MYEMTYCNDNMEIKIMNAYFFVYPNKENYQQQIKKARHFYSKNAKFIEYKNSLKNQLFHKIQRNLKTHKRTDFIIF